MISERVRKLREESIRTRPWISTERAELLTEFYKSGIADSASTPVARALAFKHVLQNKHICINEGELIVGERGSGPKATPTYPELCCHSLRDLETLNTRERTPFKVSEESIQVYQKEIIPYWERKTMRDKVFASMTKEWNDAFAAGVFTEFMEQRAPGHAIADDKVYRKGFVDLIADIDERLDQLDFFGDSEAYSKGQNLKAMRIAAEALILFAERYSEHAKEQAKVAETDERRKELERIAEICAHVPANPPRDFWEALQMYWFAHLGVIIELNVWDSFNPGRLDQHLYPFYVKDLETNTLTDDFARELLGCFWVKFNNQPAPPKVDITEEQSGTYQDFALINSGGLGSQGEDCVNAVSYMLLDVAREMKLIQPSICIQLSAQTPNAFLSQAIDVVKEGFGQPSMFNTDTIIQEFLRAGKSMEDARAGGPSGCVTISAFGKESCILTGYCNWPKILEITLNNGIDPNSGTMIGLETGDPREFSTFKELLSAYKKQLRHFIDTKIKGNNVIERLYAEHMPAPFLSLLFDDCIARGKDYHNGGPRYNSTYIQGVGIGTITDSLSAIKHHVFDEEHLSMNKLLELLETDFKDDERTRLMLVNHTPTYGNDDDKADSIAVEVFNAYFDAIDGRPNTKGGQYRVNLLPTTVHIYFGQITGASPNGRKAGKPLSDGISPSHGADRKGPTAVVKSAAKIDHVKTGGTLLNQKLMPALLKDSADREKLGHLIRAYFKLGGHHIQFNVVDTDTLRDAQANPENYRDLIVRVAGYSDYFVDIGRDLQQEIIQRTMQKEF